MIERRITMTRITCRLAAGLFVALACAAPAVIGQGWTPPRLPDGQPDIQGEWRAVPGGTHDMTAVISGGAIFDRELAIRDGRPVAKLPSRVTDPADGQIPYQPWARAKQQEIARNASHPVERRHIDPRARCLPGGVPRETFPTGFHFKQFKDHVVFLGEQKHVTRVIPLDGRPHLDDGIKLWMGSSRGRWEGNTLVIDVRNQNSKGRFDMMGNFASDRIHVVERWTIVDANTLHYSATIDDPSVYTRPWTLESRIVRAEAGKEPYDDEIWEDACHEGERSAEHMLLPPKAERQPESQPERCTDAIAAGVPGARRATVTRVAAGTFRPRSESGGSAAGGASAIGATAESSLAALPAFCRVELALAPHPQSDIGVEVWLPVSGWNGRFQGVGNRGWGGAINYSLLADALRAGFAAASTDTGHRGSGTSFAIGQPEKVIDAGYRAVHEMTVAAKRVTEAYYGRPAAHAYWNGCSLGGRQGLTEAQRYPDDYDGILVGDPVHELTSLYSARLALARIVHRSPGSFIPPEKYPAIHNAVLAACDALDGVADGVLEDPRRCRFDPGTLQCADGDGPNCLTVEQVQTARAIYADVVHPRTGAPLSAALTPGAELRWGAIAGASPERNALGLFRDVVFGDAAWDWKGSGFAAAIDRVARDAGPVLDAASPDLSAFFARGGKLLLYHGWADPQTPAGNTIRYVEAVTARVGRERAAGGVRLFMAPGMGHCAGGEGPDTFDAMAPLQRWVEKGEPPSAIEAAIVRDGKVVRTRPLCAFGTIAVWDGRGDPARAASFSCQPDNISRSTSSASSSAAAATTAATANGARQP